MFCTHCGNALHGAADNYCAQCGRATTQGAGHEGRAPRRLFRLHYDKALGGVCSGLARYMDVDVTLIRVLAILGVLCSAGLVILGYIAAWILMPVDYTIPRQASATVHP